MAELKQRFATIQETATAWANTIDNDAEVSREMIDAYHTRGNTDRPYSYSRTEISGLIPEFTNQTAYRTLFNKALTNFQDTLLTHALNARIQEAATTKRLVIFAGGSGSGKTTTLPYVLSRYTNNEPHAIWDTTSKNSASVSTVINNALMHEKLVDIYFVYRPYQEAAKAAVSRALRMTSSLEHGKITSPRLLTNAHYRAPHTMDQLIKHYRGDKRVTFTLVDNSQSKGSHTIRPLESDFLLPLLNRNECEMERNVNEMIQKNLDQNENHPRQPLVRAALSLANDSPDRILS